MRHTDMWTDGRAIVYNMLCICTLKSLQSSVSRLPGMQKLGSKSLRRPCVSDDVILHVFIFFVDRKHNYMSRDYRVRHVFPPRNSRWKCFHLIRLPKFLLIVWGVSILRGGGRIRPFPSELSPLTLWTSLPFICGWRFTDVRTICDSSEGRSYTWLQFCM